MKFAHLADCHLGSWRIQELQDLNMQCFRKAIDICIQEKVSFVLMAGDIFDSAYPPIETLKETFFEFKKLKDQGIPCFIIAGSHDYSASGKTFLDVLEKAGLCKNACIIDQENQSPQQNHAITLNPVIYNNTAIFGYPGKKSGMEIPEIRKIKLNDAPGFYKILMLHTTMEFAKGSLPIDAVNEEELPKVDYYALGHLHIEHNFKNFVYAGPIFPNNFQELEELKGGKFYIVETYPQTFIKKIDLRLKQVEVIDLEIENALVANELILHELSKRNLKDKILMIKLSGILKKGKMSNINFAEIEKSSKDKGAYCILRSVSQLSLEEPIAIQHTDNIDVLEEEILKKFEKKEGPFNSFLMPLMKVLIMEKQEDEKSVVFETRLCEELNKLLELK